MALKSSKQVERIPLHSLLVLWWKGFSGVNSLAAGYLISGRSIHVAGPLVCLINGTSPISLFPPTLLSLDFDCRINDGNEWGR